MASLDIIHTDEQAQSLIRKLEDIPYACSSLKRLSGGSANYVYRGVLDRPIPSQDGSLTSKTIIVKYSLSHLPGNVEFALDLSRCGVEKSMLEHLKGSSLASRPVIVPHIYFSHRDSQGNIQVQEDFPQAKDMTSSMRSPVLNGFLDQSVMISVSHEVGSWLRSFHEWTSASQQAEFRQRIGCNEPMQKLKHQVTYGTFMNILQNFPSILQDNIEILEKVKQRAESELEDLTSVKEREHYGIIHGDFWMGK
ncbi:hypothetical protein NW762_014374 [Fusarium torreyae]|uniref:Aminoglycoside phosphotransferase domain-containing protein n=1 Tax=Fusarium torreyae TaxID=1237075 RepID=A0A9W8V6P7_9HYPO|nr:hypothetical protein NW762_014374 [Fusarium torreyae]